MSGRLRVIGKANGNCGSCINAAWPTVDMVINDWIVMVRQSAALLSVEFELYLVKEFQRLKAAEQAQLGWSAKRELAKINYRIHTDAIQQHLIPAVVTRAQMSIIYANEADVLNVALFGQTHQQWQLAHPGLKGNQRDYADINHLICMSNMENLNAVMIQDGIPQPERLRRLNEIAIHQMRVLSSGGGRNLLR